MHGGDPFFPIPKYYEYEMHAFIPCSNERLDYYNFF